MLTAKTQRISDEFQTLKTKNAALAQLIVDLTAFIEVELKKDIVMTMIFRTQQEQWDLYKKTDGAKTTRKSPHMYWHAVDLRDWIYTPDEKKKIGKFLVDNYDATNQLGKLGSGNKTYWLHKIKGQAMHFHVQYKGTQVMVFQEGLTITA